MKNYKMKTDNFSKTIKEKLYCLPTAFLSITLILETKKIKKTHAHYLSKRSLGAVLELKHYTFFVFFLHDILHQTVPPSPVVAAILY